MNKALIHYFSGTGNSLLAATLLSKELIKYGYSTVLHSIEDGNYIKDANYSIHIFLFPVYATSVPHIMLKYFRKLPYGKASNAAVISVNGRISTNIRDGYQGWALHQARLYLKARNYKVFLSETLDFPHNVTIAIPPRKEKYNDIIISKALKNLSITAEKISKKEVYHRRIFLPNILWSLPFGLLYNFIGRRVIGKLFAADSSCNSCGSCVKNCPVKAIRMKAGSPKWKLNCEGCLRCINSCPKKAIQISIARLLVLFSVLFLDLLLPGRDQLYELFNKIDLTFVNTVLNFLLFLIIFLILDWMIFKISHITLFKKIIGFGFTRFFGRYSAKEMEGHIK